MNTEKLRSETPGCAHVTHFNNAGSALMPQPVIDAQQNYLNYEINQGGYEAVDHFREQLNETYQRVAQLINADATEIALLESATTAWVKAFFSLTLKAGDRIVTAKAEYATNYINYLHLEKSQQVSIEVVPNDESGQISVAALEKLLEADQDKTIKLISITHIPTNGGLVNPAEEVGKLAKKYGVLFLLDACQSVGQMPIDVQKIGCDMLSATGRKYLRAPRGTGFLYIRKSLLETIEPREIDMFAAEWTSTDTYKLRDDARKFEYYEYNPANRMGLSAAVQYALDLGLDNIWSRIQHLGEILRTRLAEIPNVTVHDLGQVKGGIVSFGVQGIKTEFIKQKLREEGINVSLIIASGTLLDMQDRSLDHLVRASVHYYNTEAEIDQLCGVIKKIILVHTRIEHS
ncbi:aminotransferase class V [marine bacterium AO1-C]|nr:aminotransferase class V [marine bacterium AO1-C]